MRRDRRAQFETIPRAARASPAHKALHGIVPEEGQVARATAGGLCPWQLVCAAQGLRSGPGRRDSELLPPRGVFGSPVQERICPHAVHDASSIEPPSSRARSETMFLIGFLLRLSSLCNRCRSPLPPGRARFPGSGELPGPAGLFRCNQESGAHIEGPAHLLPGICPSRSIRPKMGGTFIPGYQRSAATGKDLERLPGIPPPVMCAIPVTSCSSSRGLTSAR